MRIAASFLGGGVLTLLDEPLEGLAPESRLAVRALVKGVVRTTVGPNSYGRSCVVATRCVDEAVALSSRVALLVHGHLISLCVHCPPSIASACSTRSRLRYCVVVS